MRAVSFAITPLLATSVLGIGCFSGGQKWQDNGNSDTNFNAIKDMCNQLSGTFFNAMTLEGIDPTTKCANVGENSIDTSVILLGSAPDQVQLSVDDCVAMMTKPFTTCANGGEFSGVDGQPGMLDAFTFKADPQAGNC
ncbi:hypothetical protein K491DRAFT_773546 [Lophiostoma macrostomum CBS 122681]|uniref:Ecp2 effector protein domain-containing protein n=1 Tax=Lophiostoma macrostomum CBS 122681 TaxID=1314788 RepID=A0A6A6TS48_9PLEO|nr:hypothetical protein K491DRAFT_773546 [Lophiostoma macrostomum CBS 122681]